MVSLIPIWETVSHIGLQQACWHNTTNLSCCGDQECRRRLRCQLWKPNIIQHLKLQSRSFIFATRYDTWAYHRRTIHLCMRITPHALNGEIMSLVVVNVQSISISTSTSHTKSSSTATCDSSGFQRRVPTEEQLADIFTKALPFPQFERCLMGLMGGDLKPKGPWASRGGEEH